MLGLFANATLRTNHSLKVPHSDWEMKTTLTKMSLEDLCQPVLRDSQDRMARTLIGVGFICLPPNQSGEVAPSSFRKPRNIPTEPLPFSPIDNLLERTSRELCGAASTDKNQSSNLEC